MASSAPIFQSQSLLSNARLRITSSPSPLSCRNLQPGFAPKSFHLQFQVTVFEQMARMSLKPAAAIVVSATTAEKPKKRYPRGSEEFGRVMRFLPVKYHTRCLAEEKAVPKLEPSVDGYLRFLVDWKLVYDTLEKIIEKAAFPFYSELKNTGLERSEALAKDLEWFREQGYNIPEPSSPGIKYSQFLKGLSEKDPLPFICHFYNINLAHTAGARYIRRNILKWMLNVEELEFYKPDRGRSQLLEKLRVKLCKAAESWTREEKNHCFKENEAAREHYKEIFLQIFSCSA